MRYHKKKAKEKIAKKIQEYFIQCYNVRLSTKRDCQCIRAESEEELRSLLMKVKERSKKLA